MRQLWTVSSIRYDIGDSSYRINRDFLQFTFDSHDNLQTMDYLFQAGPMISLPVVFAAIDVPCASRISMKFRK